METFDFKPAEDPQSAPQPLIAISISFRGHSSVITALFDTGSDITHLSRDWTNYFNVDASLVPELPVGMLGDHEVSGALAFVNARLDGHDFTMPVLFHSDETTNLFGRPGVMELYAVEIDCVASELRVEWKHAIETGADRMKHDLLAVEGNFLNGWDVDQ
jgi:hypothetical protein